MGKIERRLMSLGAGGETSKACFGADKTCEGDEAVQAALLMALDAMNTLRKERAVREAAIRHFRQWKG